MRSTRTHHGLEIRLRPRGPGRFFSAAFLGVWLCGWALGETIALWILIRGAIALVTGTPPEPGRDLLQTAPSIGVGLFLLVWVTFWTIGGIAAISELLRLVWAEDRLVVHPGGVRLTRSRGPFRSTREFARDALRAAGLARRRETLTLWTNAGSAELSTLGTRADREEAAALLRSEIRIAEAADAPGTAVLPEGWEATLTPEGERALVPATDRRRIQARVASIVALALLGLTFIVARETARGAGTLIFALVLLALASAIAAGAVWLARGRMEWAIGGGRIVLRRRFGAALKPVFEAHALEVTVSKDSDGDEWFQLDALADPAAPAPGSRETKQRRRRVHAVMNDPTEPRQMGAWLAQASGVPFEDRSLGMPAGVDLAEVRARLENAGPFGKWLAKRIGGSPGGLGSS